MTSDILLSINNTVISLFAKAPFLHIIYDISIAKTEKIRTPLLPVNIRAKRTTKSSKTFHSIFLRDFAKSSANEAHNEIAI